MIEDLVFRLRTMGRKARFVAGAIVAVAVLALAVAVHAATRNGGGNEAREPTNTGTSALGADVYYLRALAAKTRVSGCTMQIRYAWKPHYQALAYVGTTALIEVTGPAVGGTYRRPFSRQGATLELPAVSLGGGYQVWSARVLSVGGDPPGNDTTIHAAPPTSTRCR
jgi:hypothetical protein